GRGTATAGGVARSSAMRHAYRNGRGANLGPAPRPPARPWPKTAGWGDRLPGSRAPMRLGEPIRKIERYERLDRIAAFAKQLVDRAIRSEERRGGREGRGWC